MNVSIVIPTHKRPNYLDRLLKSIKKQTVKSFEVIIIDDHSPEIEQYLELIDKYKNEFDELTFLRNKENMGAPFSRNQGIYAAKYDYVALVDDDDEWYPQKIEKQIEIIEKSSDNVGIVYTWADIAYNGEIISRYTPNTNGIAKKEILKECFIPSPSVLIKKEALIRSGLFDEKFKSCQDWDMWTRIIFNNYSCIVIEESLSIYNKHSESSIGNNDNANEGYKQYFAKHKMKYIKMLMFEKLLKNVWHFYIRGK